MKSNTEVYAEIIADIASRAAAEIEGAELLGKNPDKLRIIKDNDVHAYVKSDNTVDIDIYLNILYGYNIPDTVCKVQIAIKKQSKRNLLQGGRSQRFGCQYYRRRDRRHPRNRSRL